jgi:hypothetical protein
MNETVFDLTEWIPSGGEDHFSFRRRDSGEVELCVRYERDESPQEIHLVFVGASYFVNQPFPGLNVLAASGGSKDVKSLELAELHDSDLVRQCVASWKQYVSDTSTPDYHHYFIYSYEMGELFHVVAESVTIEHDEPS